MAIKLEVEDYCEWCMDFSAEVTSPVKTHIPGHEDLILTDTIVRCEYRNRCRAIKRYLERQKAKELESCETE